MARIRSTHPGQWVDDMFVQMTFQGRLLAIAIRNFADDRGVFEWKPFMLKMQIFPADNLDVDQLLSELLLFQHIARFEHEGRSYGAIRNFVKWQRPRDPKPVYPLPADMERFVGIGLNEADKFVSLRADLCREQDGGCFYCGTEITHYSKRATSLEIDHKIPKSRGGTEDRANLVAACRACNRMKGTMTAEEFSAAIAENVPKVGASGWRNAAREGLSRANAARRIRENDTDNSDEGGRREEGGWKETSPDGDAEKPPPADDPPVLPLGDAAAPPAAKELPIFLTRAVETWNEVCGDLFGKVVRLTDTRQRHLRARLQEWPSDTRAAEWRAYCERMVRSDFLSGRRGRNGAHANWRPNFDWAVNAANAAKVVEGQYDNQRDRQQGHADEGWVPAEGTV